MYPGLEMRSNPDRWDLETPKFHKSRNEGFVYTDEQQNVVKGGLTSKCILNLVPVQMAAEFLPPFDQRWQKSNGINIRRLPEKQDGFGIFHGHTNFHVYETDES